MLKPDEAIEHILEGCTVFFCEICLNRSKYLEAFREQQKTYREIAVQQLHQAISDVSEDEYAAGWAMGIEAPIYRAVFGLPGTHLVLSDKQVQDFKRLALAANGWFYWPLKALQPYIVSLEEAASIFGTSK